MAMRIVLGILLLTLCTGVAPRQNRQCNNWEDFKDNIEELFSRKRRSTTWEDICAYEDRLIAGTSTTGLKVNTTSGVYVGQYEDITTYGREGLRKSTSFYGIRYGTAKRFEASQQAPYCPTAQKASHHSKICHQLDLTGLMPGVEFWNMDEDCLTLNIYIPGDMATNTDHKPVMLWVHPGGLQHEAAFRYNGTQLALNGDVIVVTIQYRLGLFGFFNLGELSTTASNNGLRDILSSLKWVKNNIEKFGGDSKKVTLFGQSGGSMAISQLLASPLSEGLFHRAIAMSGSINTVGVRKCSDVVQDSKVAAAALNCNQASTAEMTQCVQTANPVSVIETQPSDLFALWSDRFNLPFIGCYGDDINPEHPMQAYSEGKTQHVELIMGVTNHDGIFAMPFTFQYVPSTADLVKHEIKKFATELFPFSKKRVMNAIFDFYNNSLEVYPDTDSLRYDKMLLDIHTERMILNIYQCLAYHSAAHGRSYFYNQNYEVLPTTYSFIQGSHGVDIGVALGNYLVEEQWEFFVKTDAMLDVVRVTQNAWSSFARNGVPNNMEASSSVTWPQLQVRPDVYKGEYLEFSRSEVDGLATPTVKEGLRDEATMKFWLETLPALPPDVEGDVIVDDVVDQVPEDDVTKRRGLLKYLGMFT